MPEVRRIVLADDEEVLAWSLATRMVRRRPGWEIETANDGETALARIAQIRATRGGPLDLLIADVRMPGMSGADLIVAARREQPFLPAIVMTAFRVRAPPQVAGAPFTAFIEKPFELERLVSLAEQAMSRPGVAARPSARQTLLDIVELYLLSFATGRLIVRRGAEQVDGEVKEGSVWLHHGAILHAAHGDRVGQEAFHEIMTWGTEQVQMWADVRTSERSIRAESADVVAESRRRQGEVLGDLPGRPDATTARGELHARGPDAAKQPGDPRAGAWEEGKMGIKESLSRLNEIDGFIGAALVDSETGRLLGQEGGGPLNLEVAAAGNTEVVRAKRKTMSSLALKDQIEDILITLGRQYHLLRPLRTRTTLFFYVALDRQRADLATVRRALVDVENDLRL